ncbi:hypothetical protein AZA_46402 [Nitrospirillum viridazoti Y2]|nr:hypothetical protein AZA_46402 [Nitrospirillum amazonense Y2]
MPDVALRVAGTGDDDAGAVDDSADPAGPQLLVRQQLGEFRRRHDQRQDVGRGAVPEHRLVQGDGLLVGDGTVEQIADTAAPRLQRGTQVRAQLAAGERCPRRQRGVHQHPAVAGRRQAEPVALGQVDGPGLGFQRHNITLGQGGRCDQRA